MGRPVQLTPVLSDKRYRLVQEYFDNGFNKKKAMYAAGYAKTMAEHQAHRVFAHPAVVAEITRRKDQREDTSQLSREWIVSRLMRLAESSKDMSKFIKVADDGALYWDFSKAKPEELQHIVSLHLDFYTDGKGDFARNVKKFNFETTKPLEVLNTLARIEGLYKDRLRLEGDEGVIEALHAGRRRANLKAHGESDE